MPPISLIFKFAPYLLLLAVLGGGWTAIETLRTRNANLTAQLVQARVDVKTAKGVNDADQRVIDNVKEALALWQTKAAAAQTAETDAVAKLAAATAVAVKSTNQARGMEKRDESNAACERLLGTSVGSVCPGHVDAVRMRVVQSDLQGQTR